MNEQGLIYTQEDILTMYVHFGVTYSLKRNIDMCRFYLGSNQWLENNNWNENWKALKEIWNDVEFKGKKLKMQSNTWINKTCKL